LLMTATRGTALIHQQHAGWMPWAGELPHRQGGAMVADRLGTSTGFALDNLQKRGELFIGPNVDVYEGMIIGEHNKDKDLNVNPCKEKKLTNMRAAGKDESTICTPVRRMSLERAINFIKDDEMVEVTPQSIRLHKRVLSAQKRHMIR